jgi:hypothetical protein
VAVPTIGDSGADCRAAHKAAIPARSGARSSASRPRDPSGPRSAKGFYWCPWSRLSRSRWALRHRSDTCRSRNETGSHAIARSTTRNGGRAGYSPRVCSLLRWPFPSAGGSAAPPLRWPGAASMRRHYVGSGTFQVLGFDRSLEGAMVGRLLLRIPEKHATGGDVDVKSRGSRQRGRPSSPQVGRGLKGASARRKDGDRDAGGAAALRPITGEGRMALGVPRSRPRCHVDAREDRAEQHLQHADEASGPARADFSSPSPLRQLGTMTRTRPRLPLSTLSCASATRSRGSGVPTLIANAPS